MPVFVCTNATQQKVPCSCRCQPAFGYYCKYSRSCILALTVIGGLAHENPKWRWGRLLVQPRWWSTCQGPSGHRGQAHSQGSLRWSSSWVDSSAKIGWSVPTRTPWRCLGTRHIDFLEQDRRSSKEEIFAAFPGVMGLRKAAWWLTIPLCLLRQDWTVPSTSILHRQNSSGPSWAWYGTKKTKYSRRSTLP